MYYETLAQCIKMIENVGRILQKAKAHADAKKFDPNNYLTARLAPDMLPFCRQVQIVCDGPKFMGAYLSGQEAPKHEDNEKTLDELIERTHKSLSFLRTLKPEHFAGAGERKVRVPWMPGKYITGHDYMVNLAVPNFYFHVTLVYALLRHAGVELGKMDYLGSVPFQEG